MIRVKNKNFFHNKKQSFQIFFNPGALKLVADCVEELLTVEVELATLLFLANEAVDAEFIPLFEEKPLLRRLIQIVSKIA